MGISKLVGNLNPAMKDVTLDQIEGSTVGVDATCWVYKRGKNEYDRIGFFHRMIPLFEHYRIKPIFVLDGKVPKLKMGVDDAKRPSDQTLITYLKSKNLEFIVAPYESDAQLAYLQREKYIKYIFSDDGDLVVYNCDNIIFKWNGQAGRLYTRDKLLQFHENCDLRGFTFNQFFEICLLVGCDYVSNIRNVGWSTACKHMRTRKSLGVIEVMFRRMRQFSTAEMKAHWENIYKTRMIFKHMQVYDMNTRKLVYLEKLEDNHGFNDLDFLGGDMDDKTVWEIVHGYRSPNNNEMYKYKNDINPYKIDGPHYYFDEVNLDISLETEQALVTSTISGRRIIDGLPLVLYGNNVELVSISVNGENLKVNQYYRYINRLVLLELPSEPFTLKIDTKIAPPKKTSSEQPDQHFCPQCLVEGLRMITFYQDIMAKKYKCRIEADKSRYPFLSSNGIIIDQGEGEGKTHFAIWKDVSSLEEGIVECNHQRRRDIFPGKVVLRQQR